MKSRPLGGMTTQVRGICVLFYIAAFAILLTPYAQMLGGPALATALAIQIVARSLFPEKSVAVEDGALHVRTPSSKHRGQWTAPVQQIKSIRIIGPYGARKLQVHFEDESVTELLLQNTGRQNRLDEQFLVTSELANRVDIVPPPSWMNDIRGYDEN